jgi:2-(3-amino-3-carboxypropyl)histidine synthase
VVKKTEPILNHELVPGFGINLDDVLAWVRSQKKKTQTLALQLPAGLMLSAINIIKKLETELNTKVILFADPCFGACDLVEEKLKSIGIDAILHIGHAEIPSCSSSSIPIKFVELKSSIDPVKLLKMEKNRKALKSELKSSKTIGIIANVQFLSYLDSIKSFIETLGYKVQIGKGDNRIKHDGQVLGCNFSSAKSILGKVDTFLFIGDGQFHPLGVSLATKKKVIAFDPMMENIKNISFLKDKILRQRGGANARAKHCKDFGIIITTKPGQNRKEYAMKILNKLKKHDLNGTLIAMDHVSPDKLDYLPVDVYISTACPRLVIDDYTQYKKVMLTPIELEIILGERTWNQYKFDEIM